MSESARQRIRAALPLAFSVGVLTWLFTRVDLATVARSVDARVVAVMVPAMALYGAATLWLEALSIRRMLPAHVPGFGLWKAARVKCASYLPGLLHYTLGIGTVAVLLRRQTGLRLGEAASTIATITGTDLLVVTTSAAAAAAASGLEAGGLRTGIVALLPLAFGGGLTLLRAPFSLGPLDRLRELAIFQGLRHTPLPRLAELLGLRTVFCCCFIAGCASAFFAFEISVPFATLITGTLLVALVSTLPIAVAGLGTSQAAFVYLFGDYAPDETLLALSLVLSFAMLALRALMGLVFARELTREALSEAQVAET